MNYLWCDMWEYRKDELLSMKSNQLATILEMTQNLRSAYSIWRTNFSDEDISALIERLKLEDVPFMKKLVEAAIKLT